MIGRSLAGWARNESDAHYDTKRLIAHMVSAATQPLIVTIDTGFAFRSYHLDLRAARPVIECAWPTGDAVDDIDAYFAEHGDFPDFIFDVGLTVDGALIGGFEIVLTNGLSPEKRCKIHAAGLFCFTIQARSRLWYVDGLRIDVQDHVLPPHLQGMLGPIDIYGNAP